jgi:hypothetical protein
MSWWYACFALLFLACEQPGTRPTQPEVAPVASADAAFAVPDAALPPVVTGPDGTEKTVKALLRGESEANRFPIYATDDGKPVDDGLREEIVPRLKGKIEIKRIDGAPEAAVKQILKTHMARLMGCYQRGLLNNPTLSGGMSFELTLDANGRTTDGKAWGEVPDSRVQSCTLERLRQLEYPKPVKVGEELTITLALISDR